MRPAACTASRTRTPPAAFTSAPISRDGLDDAGLVVGGVDRDQRQALRRGRAAPARARSAPRSSTPLRVDRRRVSTSLARKASTVQQAGMIGGRDIEPRHADRAAPHPPVGRKQRRSGFGRAGGENDMLGLGARQVPRPRRRASSIRRRAARPSPCTDDGFASASSAASIAARAAGKQRRACIVIEIGAVPGHFFAIFPVISHSRAVRRYFLEIARSAVLFTRFTERVASPPSFEQF